MSPALFLILAMFAADADVDAPVATAPEARAVRELPQPKPRPPAKEPASDYELVAWCYGALGGHMGLHDVAMPEVTRIERRWAKTPEEAEEDIESYAVQQKEGAKALALFREAMKAAEMASIDPIQEKGVAAIRDGESIWMGADMADPKRLAHEWMSWGLPQRCMTTAEKLEAEASVLGQALNANAEATDEEALEAMEGLTDSEAAMTEAEALQAIEDAVDWDEPEDEAAEEEPADEEPDADAPTSIDEIIARQAG